MSSLCFLDCARPSDAIAHADIVIGGVTKSGTSGTEKKITQGMPIFGEETITAPEKAKIKLTLSENNVLYVNENTTLQLSTASSSGPGADERDVTVSMPQGECYYAIAGASLLDHEYRVVTPYATIRSRNAHFNVLSQRRHIVVSVLQDTVSLLTLNGDSAAIGPCRSVAVHSSGAIKTVSPLSKDQVRYLSQWVGTRNIEEHLALSGCRPHIPGDTSNTPPVWRTLPAAQASIQTQYLDSVRADDPDGDSITYMIERAPAGMRIDSLTGIIRFTPARKGTFEFLAKAVDSHGASIEKQCSVRVTAPFSVHIDAPPLVRPGRQIRIRASSTPHSEQRRDAVRYRFDINGDGVWDYPASGRLSTRSVISHTFEKPGVYALRIQGKSAQGLQDMAFKKITVNGPPTARISITPSYPTLHKRTMFLAHESTDPNDQPDRLVTRWRFTRAGTAGDTVIQKTSTLDTVAFSWDTAGTYRVTLTLTDPYGQTDSAVTPVTVRPGLHIDSLTGPDTVALDSTVRLQCFPADLAHMPDVRLHWDVGDTAVSHPADTTIITHRYNGAGTYRVMCIASDTVNGATDSAMHTIVVQDAPTHVDAGGPYSVHVNETLHVEATVSDSDSKIVSYAWDFDNDGKFEWFSKNKTSAHYVYQHADTHTVLFQVQTAQDKSFSDSTTVIVINSPPRVQAGEDILAVKPKNVQLEGKAEDPDGQIMLYEWDFDADGTYDWSSSKSGSVSHRFTQYTRAVFRVTDFDSARASDTLRVVICPDNMKAVSQGKYCIDKYEFPNENGTRPLRNVTYAQAVEHCAQQGKHLCTPREWKTACRGTKGFTYPYGNSYQNESCNTQGNSWVDNALSESGRFSPCRSTYGVMDMSGNVAEWVASADSVHASAYGGSWQNSAETSTCNSRLTLEKSKSYFYVGFRCCK
jgi:PKD repeat protein